MDQPSEDGHKSLDNGRHSGFVNLVNHTHEDVSVNFRVELELANLH
jgi:hypothetical protein